MSILISIIITLKIIWLKSVCITLILIFSLKIIIIVSKKACCLTSFWSIKYTLSCIIILIWLRAIKCSSILLLKIIIFLKSRLPIIVLISWKKFTPRRVEILTLISILFLITKKSSSKWALILWSSKWIIFIFVTLKKTILWSLVSKIIWLTFSITKKFLWIWSLKIFILVLSCLIFWIVKKFLLVLIHLTKFLRPSKRLRLFLLLCLLLNWLIVIKKIIVVTFCWKILAFLVLKKIITFTIFKKCILITFVLGIIIWFLLILIAIVEEGLFNFKFIFVVFFHHLVLILLRLIIRFLLIEFGSTIKKRCFFLRSLIILIKKTRSFFSFFFI